ncbi:MAG: TonB-dependent receptor [Blastocatellia bacterium]|nr:TonB-dependent receptor [Blastocatellia bacterium]
MFGNRIWLRLSSLVMMAALTITQGLAQTRNLSEANLRVRVLDPNGAVIPGARVHIGADPSQSKSVETDSRGEAVFTRLAAGKYRLRVEAEGFEPLESDQVTLHAGANNLEVRLEIARVKEEVVVEQDKREKETDRRGDAFSTVLTPDQIAQLPDDPEEFENALRQMAGPGATFRINGFRGGRLPPKSQIREIRFRLNPYVAENHEAGFIGVDITTKPGINDWNGSFNAGFRDESLNARNAFAPFRAPEQTRRFAFDIGGPLWRNHTSLFLSADGADEFDSNTIVAALPEGSFSDVIRRPLRRFNFSARAEHALGKSHTMRAEYQRNTNRRENLGVGDFDLAERAYSTDLTENLFRLSDSGAIGKRLVSEFRFQARWQETRIDSLSQAPSILVLNAFNSGGAQVNSDRRVREFELAENLDFVVRKHSMRAGVLFEAEPHQSDELRNANGTFTFSSLDAFRAGLPTTFTQRAGDPLVAFDQYQFGWYWQDDVRVRKDLSVNFGVRHEVQNHLGDHNNFAPRAGLAWSPFKSGKTTIRAGGGIFYDWFGASAFEQTLRVNGTRQSDIVIRNPGFPDPSSGGTVIALPPSRIRSDPALSMPYVAQSSISIEQQVRLTTRLRASYFYQRGLHLLRGRNINAPVPEIGRPFPDEGNITQVESSASSTLHLLNLGANFMQPQKGFFLSLNYVLSKNTNESDGPFSLPADNFNLRAERGPSSADSRHRFFALLNMRLFKGLRLGTVFQASSATPYNITTGFDDNGDTISNDRPAGVSRNSTRGSARWDMGTRLSWGFSFGKEREASAQGGPQVRVIRAGSDALGSMPSMSASNKRWRTEFYLQAYNLLNHANLMNFTGVETSPFFGQATAAQPGRRLEVGMRFGF